MACSGSSLYLCHPANVRACHGLREEKDSLAQLAAEKECEADATAEAAAQLAEEADVAQKALFRVSDSILRWRDQLSVVSLTQETYGQEPTAQEVLHVIGDMDHEVQVSVLQESALPADLKLKLVAKRAELAAKLEAEKEKAEFDKACRAAAAAAVTSSSSSSSAAAPPSFQHRHVLDAPDKLVRLMAMASAARSAALATDGSADKENVHGAPQRTASGGVHPTGRPLASVMPNAARLVDDAQQQGPRLGAKRGGSPAAAKKRVPAGAIRAQPAPAAPPCEPPAVSTAAPERAVPSRLTLVELSDDKSSILAPGCDLTLPGELPGASSDAWADEAPLSLVPFLPSLKLSRAHTLPKRNVQGRRGGGSVDRRTALTAAVAAFESEEAVLVPRLALR
jgi:hypothetical protein